MEANSKAFKKSIIAHFIFIIVIFVITVIDQPYFKSSEFNTIQI